MSPPAYRHLSLVAFPEAATQTAHMVQKTFRIYVTYESRTMVPVYIWKKNKITTHTHTKTKQKNHQTYTNAFKPTAYSFH